MAREPYRGVELAEGYRPVAAPVDTFVTAQVPSRDTSLQDLARSLSTLGGSLGQLVGKRDKEAEEDDRIRGRAAFWEANGVGAAEAVSKGLMPAQASPSFIRGWKETEGSVAGAQLQEKFSAAYDTWEGKSSTDPQAFAGFLGGFIKDNVKTQDPDVLKGLWPQVEQLRANWQNKHIGDVSRAAQQGYTTAMAARGDQLIDQANTAGLASKTGTDYAKVFGELEAIRADGLKRGANEAQTDEKLIDTITAAAITKRDPKLLDFMDRKVPGKDYAWGNTPYGREQRQKTIDTLETMGRRAVAEDEKKRKEEKAEQKDAVTRDSIKWALDHPKEPVPEELLARGEKVDPDFRLNVLRNRKLIESDRTASDPDELTGLTHDIMLRGGGIQAVQKAWDRGVFRNRGDLEHAVKLAEGMQKDGPKLDAMTKLPAFRDLVATIKKRTASEKDANKIFDDGSFSPEGLQASADATQMALQWLQNNPNAGPIEQNKALSEIGANVLGRITQPEERDKIFYDRQGLEGPNVYGAAQPPAAGSPGTAAAPVTRPGQPPVSNPFAGTTVRVPSGLPGATDEDPAPTAQPSTVPAPAAPQAAPQSASRTSAPAPAAPAASSPAAPAPAGRPAGEAQGWFNGLPPEFRGELERMAATEKKPLQMKVEELYRKGRAAGSIPAPVAAPTAPAIPAAPTAPAPAPVAPAPAAPAAPGKRTEAPRAPDGTPIETASARTGDDAVTREVIESFRRAVGPAITRDQAAKAPRIEGGAPPTPVPTSLQTEKGSIPVPANSAVAMVDDGPRGHINHGVISLKAPDGSILGQYRFVNGGGGAGTIPHGAYDVTNFRDAATRAGQGLSNLGDTFDLNDVFDARAGRTRTALRIHEAHGDGTLGCIGIQGGAAAWRDFTGKMRTLVEQGGGKYTLVLGSEEGGGQGQTPTAQEGFSRVLGTTGKAVGGYASPALQADTRAARILDFVAGAELNPANGGNYNAFFGNAGSTEDLGKRTLDQTILWSEDRGTKSSATGRYQFMADTLRDLKRTMKLSGREQFTPELQDRMALALLERRGYRDYATGRLSAEDFANNLAKEWASLPNLTTGRSHYAGDGVNKALVSPEQVRSVLEGTGAFPGARLASVAKTLAAPVTGSGFLSRVRGMFGGGSGPEVTSTPAPEPAPATARSALLPAPVQASHERILAGLEPDVAAVVRRAQADNPNLRLAAVSGRGGSVEVRAVGPDGRAIPVGDGDEVGAALQRAAGQLGVGVNWASGTRTLSGVKKTLKA